MGLLRVAYWPVLLTLACGDTSSGGAGGGASAAGGAASVGGSATGGAASTGGAGGANQAGSGAGGTSTAGASSVGGGVAGGGGAGGGPGCAQPRDCPASPCFDPTCIAGQCGLEMATAGSPCPAGVCDGTGTCVGCLDDLDCPTDTDCADYSCDGNQSCSTMLQPPGSPCAGGFCDPNGQCGACAQACGAAECQTATCADGDCQLTDAPDGTPCSTGHCETGQCVQCVNSLDCPGFDHGNVIGQSCTYTLCNATNTCDTFSKSDGMLCGNFADGQACINGSCSGCLSSLACPGNFVCCGAPTYLCAINPQACP